jgi:hypothetical protein
MPIEKEREMSGVGMILGHTSVQLFYILGAAIILLGVVIWFGVRRTSQLTRRERIELEENARFAQRRDDPQKP